MEMLIWILRKAAGRIFQENLSIFGLFSNYQGFLTFGFLHASAETFVQFARKRKKIVDNKSKVRQEGAEILLFNAIMF